MDTDPVSGIRLGDIVLIGDMVHCPLGTVARGDASLHLGPPVMPTRVPGWAVVTALLALLPTAGLSLLFLLCREPTGARLVPVRLDAPGWTYRTTAYVADYPQYLSLARAVSTAGQVRA